MSCLYEYIIEYYKLTIGQFKNGKEEYINFLNNDFKQFESLNINDIWDVYGYKYNENEFYNDRLNLDNPSWSTVRLTVLFEKIRNIKKYTILKVSKLFKLSTVCPKIVHKTP